MHEGLEAEDRLVRGRARLCTTRGEVDMAIAPRGQGSLLLVLHPDQFLILRALNGVVPVLREAHAEDVGHHAQLRLHAPEASGQQRLHVERRRNKHSRQWTSATELMQHHNVAGPGGVIVAHLADTTRND